MYSNFQINTADDLVKGFAIAIRDGRLTVGEVHSFVLECTDGDERLTGVVLEKTLIQLECLKYSMQTAMTATTV